MTGRVRGPRAGQFWAGFTMTTPLPTIAILIDDGGAADDVVAALSLALLVVGLGLLVPRGGRAIGAGLVVGALAGVGVAFAFIVLVLVPAVS